MKIDIIRNNNDPFARYKMPKLEITTEGKSTNTRTVLLNLPDIGKSLKRSPLMLIKYICNDKGTNYDLKNQKYIIKGNYKQNELQDMIYNFIDENVLCAECNNPETFYIPGKTILMKCYACGSGRQIARNKMYNVIEKEIGDTQLENKHYEDSQVEIMDADDFDSFMSKNQLSKEKAMQTLVTKFDIEKLIILKDKIELNDTEILVNSVKEHCAEKQQHEKVREYIEFIVSNKICSKGDCYKFFMAKSKKLNKDDNAKIKNVAKEYFNN